MIIVSACLLGFNCRYDGTGRPDKTLLLPDVRPYLVPVCPEQIGGLPTPRVPSEIDTGDGSHVLEGRARVVSAQGADVTDNFLRGAEEVLRFMKLMGISAAIMTEKSPSCGVHHIKRNGVTVPGYGVTSSLLKKHGVVMVSSERIADDIGFLLGKVV